MPVVIAIFCLYVCQFNTFHQLLSLDRSTKWDMYRSTRIRKDLLSSGSGERSGNFVPGFFCAMDCCFWFGLRSETVLLDTWERQSRKQADTAAVRDSGSLWTWSRIIIVLFICCINNHTRMTSNTDNICNMIAVYVFLLCLFSLLAFNIDFPIKRITKECDEFLF